MSRKVAIIGAGPAGIYTALFLSSFSAEVHLFEQNENIGEKLKRTGGGRMNVANKIYTADCFFSKNTTEKNNFFAHASCYEISDLLAFLGIEYIWEKNRAILKSQNAKAEVERLQKKILLQKNAFLRNNTKITSIRKEKDGFLVNQEFFDIVIISSGGMFRIGEKSEKQNIYNLITSLDHNITEVSPSLSAVFCTPHLLKNISGTAFPFQIFTNSIHPTPNDGLITHFGFSGPVVLDFTAYWNPTENVFINFLPEFSVEKCKILLHEARKTKKTNLGIFGEMLPKKLAAALLEIANISAEKKIAELSKKDEQNILQLIFSYPLGIPKTLDYAGCWTTKGGVCLEEINMKTLESKKHKNLFFAGEAMDINGLCGGYHISFAMQCAKVISQSLLQTSQ